MALEELLCIQLNSPLTICLGSSNIFFKFSHESITYAKTCTNKKCTVRSIIKKLCGSFSLTCEAYFPMDTCFP